MQLTSLGHHTCALTGGKSTQRLRPHKSAFQAEVQLGSMWRFVPVRAPPAQCDPQTDMAW